MLIPFLVLLLIAFSACDCPLNCSGPSHGSCEPTTQTCRCLTGWTGDDCSIRLLTLQSGVGQDGFVGANQWQFYELNNPADGSLSCDLVPRGTAQSDCDLYAKYNDLPSSASFDAADVNWGTNAHVAIPSARAGRWVFGVFGSIFTCAFRITAKIEGACPQGCGAHGSCSKPAGQVNGTCVCQQGWAGPTCAHEIRQNALILNTVYTDSVERNTWKYFFTEFARDMNEVLVVVNVTNVPTTGHDCDVYVRKFQIPDLTAFDYKDSTANSNFAVTIPHATAGRWYIGFWGYQQCNFKLQLHTSERLCQSQCSFHGTCLPPCQCRPEYSGDACETKTAPLTSGQSDLGFVSSNSWNWYTYASDSTNNVFITVTEIGEGDCDLYVRHNERPSRLVYDYLSIGNEDNFTITVTDALQDTLHIGVLGWKDCSFRITVVQQSACPKSCSNHGTCVNGKCSCFAGFTGADCGSAVRTLYKGVVAEATMSLSNEWHFYNFTGRQNSLLIALNEDFVEADKGFLGIFVAEGKEPSFHDNIAANIDDKTQYKSITLARTTSGPDQEWDWVIGVYGSPFLSSRVPHPLRYRLVVWEPDF